MTSLRNTPVNEGDLIKYHGELYIVLAIVNVFSSPLFTLMRIIDAHIDEYSGFHDCIIVRCFRNSLK